MPPVSAATFARHLRGLDRSALAAFVAEVWSARGWETTVDGDVVTATADGETLRIAAVPGRLLPRLRPPALPDCDVVVAGDDDSRVAAAAAAADAEYTPPAALRNLLLYGLDRDVAAECYRDHVGESLLVDDAAVGSAGEVARRVDDDGDASRRPSRTTVGVLALLLLLAGGVVAGGPGVFGGRDGATAPATTYTPVGTEGVYTPIGAEATTTSTATPDRDSYPPGVSPDGIENVSALAAAHDDALAGSPYRVTVRFSGPAAATGFGNLTHGEWSLTYVDVTRYRFDEEFAFGDRPTWIRRGYANGEALYLLSRRDGETTYDRRTLGSFEEPTRVRRLVHDGLERYLASNGSVTRRKPHGEDVSVHVDVSEAPPAIAEEVLSYHAEVWTTAEGRIRAFTVAYSFRSGGTIRDVRFTVEYERVGSATLTRPAWYDEARNATDG